MTAELDPEFSLNRHWVASVLLTTSSDHQVLVEVADRLSCEFGAVVTERYGGEESSGKEYWWMEFEDANLLLLRKNGLSLGGDREHNELVVRIARAFGARFVGWRWQVWQFWHLLRTRRSRAD